MKISYKKIFILTIYLTTTITSIILTINFDKHASKKIVSNRETIINISNTSNITSKSKLSKLKEYYNNYKYITLETKTNIIKYEIFSVYVETKDFTYMNINFTNM